MEFLRFGSSIPGGYWGCCAVDIIQNFVHDPDSKASIQIVSGDGGGGLTKNGKSVFAGPTYRDIFNTRIRIGTFSTRDMPNHGFLAVLTANQLNTAVGKKWLAILKEEGFEFIRTVSNSVYGGSGVLPAAPTGVGQSLNYVFGLFRNIGYGAPYDPRKPPKEWTDLPCPYGGDLSEENVFKYQKLRWSSSESKFCTEDELVKAGAPVTLSGIRDGHRPETKEARQARLDAIQPGQPKTAFPAPEAEDDDDDDENVYEEDAEAA